MSWNVCFGTVKKPLSSNRYFVVIRCFKKASSNYQKIRRVYDQKRKIPEKYVSMPHCYNAQLNIKERHARTSANESKHINAKFLCTFVTLFKVIASLPLKRRRTPYGFHHGFLMVLCKTAMSMKNFIMTTSRIVMKIFNYLFYKFRCHRLTAIRIYKIVGVENLKIFIWGYN